LEFQEEALAKNGIFHSFGDHMGTQASSKTLSPADIPASAGRTTRTDRRVRIRVVATILSTVTLSAAWCSTATWIHFSGASALAWKIGPMLLVGSFVPAMILNFRRKHPLLRALSVVSSAALGLLNYAFVAAIICWLAAAVARLAGLPLDPRVLAFALFGGAALTTLYGLINAAWLRVTCATVRLPNLPDAWLGRTIALVSDVHAGSIHGRRFVRRIVARLNQLKPAAVFISGDMLDGTKIDLGSVVQPWTDLAAPAGAYFVSGNHDEFGDPAPLLAALERAGLRVLHNEKVEVEGLQIVGVHDHETHDPQNFQAILRRAQIDRRRPSILLAHQPSNLNIPAEAGISLQVSGHTHGGQFWPWSWVVSKVHGRFAYGLNRLDGLQVFTSSGAGTWGPPLRVGTRSEIVLLRLMAEEIVGTPRDGLPTKMDYGVR
jgi:predicted MPP superfamily phosphohydrolase